MCERFGKWPVEFEALEPEDQLKLVVYEKVRKEDDERKRLEEEKAKAAAIKRASRKKQ